VRRSKPYWRGMTKAALRERVRAVINPLPFQRAWRSDLISDLIAEKHYFCAANGLRPDAFRKMPSRHNRTGYDFEGRFDGLWHGVSWTKCIYPKGREQIIKAAMRLEIAPQMLAYRAAHPVCQCCGAAPSAEVDHVEPEFDEVANEAIRKFSDGDWRQVLGGHDWRSQERFRLPRDHWVFDLFLDLHGDCMLRAYCRRCHIIQATARREDVQC